MTKKDAQRKLDHLRKDKRAFQRGTDQYEERIKLEMMLDQHLYDREKHGQ